MSQFTETSLERKLSNLDYSNIIQLSAWIISHRSHFQAICATLYKVLVKTNKDKTILYVYLVHEIVVGSKNKYPEFIIEFGNLMKKILEYLIESNYLDVKTNLEVSKLITKWRKYQLFDAQKQIYFEKIWKAFIGEDPNTFKQEKQKLTTSELGKISYCPLCQEYGHEYKETCDTVAVCRSCGLRGHIRKDCHKFGGKLKTEGNGDYVKKEKVKNEHSFVKKEQWSPCYQGHVSSDDDEVMEISESDRPIKIEGKVNPKEKQTEVTFNSKDDCEVIFLEQKVRGPTITLVTLDEKQDDWTKNFSEEKNVGMKHDYQNNSFLHEEYGISHETKGDTEYVEAEEEESKWEDCGLKDAAVRNLTQINNNTGNSSFAQNQVKNDEHISRKNMKVDEKGDDMQKVDKKGDPVQEVAHKKNEAMEKVDRKGDEMQKVDDNKDDGVIKVDKINDAVQKDDAKKVNVVQKDEYNKGDDAQKVHEKKEDAFDPHTVILGLPLNIPVGVIRKHFEKFGRVKKVHLKRKKKKKSGALWGSAYISFAEKTVVDRVMLQRHKILDHWCYTVRAPGSELVNLNSKDKENEKKIYVGRITEVLTAEDLHQYFETFGQVRDVQISKSHQSAIVEFVDRKTTMSVRTLPTTKHLIKGVSVIVGKHRSNELTPQNDQYHQLIKEDTKDNNKNAERKRNRPSDTKPCKFGENCLFIGCRFLHPQKTEIDKDCWYGLDCARRECKFIHPAFSEEKKMRRLDKPCKFMSKCKLHDCKYSHPVSATGEALFPNRGLVGFVGGMRGGMGRDMGDGVGNGYYREGVDLDAYVKKMKNKLESMMENVMSHHSGEEVGGWKER